MKILFAILLINFLSLPLTAQEWVVPADKKGKLSPFKFDENSRKEGERLYSINCKSCHGTPGMANFQANLVPPPPDPISERLQKNLDGELFYKISSGRGPMPSFKNTLVTTDLWNVISFLRSFNKTYVQSVMPVIKSSAYPGAQIVLKLLSGPSKDEITLMATAITEKSSGPVTGAGVKLFIKRTFGRMMIDEEKTTDKSGMAVFKVPAGMPGDTAGNLQLSAVFSDEDTFGLAGKDTLLKAGTKIIPVSLTASRAMWNVVRKAPWWIILTYSLGVLGVWAFIFLIMFKLRDIFIIGDHFMKPPEKEELSS